MKRFTIITSLLSVSALLVWGFLQMVLAPKTSSAAVAPAPVYDATGEMLKAIHAGDGYVVPVTGAEEKIAPVYDATGEMLKAVHAGDGYVAPATRIVPVYDATGAMLKAINP